MTNASESSVVLRPHLIPVEHRTRKGEAKKAVRYIKGFRRVISKVEPVASDPSHKSLDVPNAFLSLIVDPNPSQTETITINAKSQQALSIHDDRKQDPKAFALGVTASLDLNILYNEARSWNDSKGMFYSWTDKLAGPLLLSYRLYLKLVADGEASTRLVMSDLYFKARKRLPGKNANLALIAVQVVTKPNSNSEKTMCSQYGSYLEYALVRNISPEVFAETMANVTLRQIREERRSAKPNTSPVDSCTDSRISRGVAEDAVSPSLLMAKVIDKGGHLTGKAEVLVSTRFTLDEDGTWLVEVLGTRTQHLATASGSSSIKG